eukprot:g24710.t1
MCDVKGLHRSEVCRCRGITWDFLTCRNMQGMSQVLGLNFFATVTNFLSGGKIALFQPLSTAMNHVYKHGLHGFSSRFRNSTLKFRENS